MKSQIQGFSFCNQVPVKKDYLSFCVKYAIRCGINHIQIIGPIHNTRIGNVDGMTLFKKYAQFNAGKDLNYIENTRRAFAEVLPEAKEHGIKVYVWHHELELSDDFATAFPETLNETGDFEIAHPIIRDYLENKLTDFYEQYPDVDGIILTLHDAKMCCITDILYQQSEKLGKELIVRPSTGKSPLAEIDIFGEFYGKGRLPLMLLDRIKAQTEYHAQFNPIGYCACIDCSGLIPFGDVNEVNLAIMGAAMKGEDPEAAARRFLSVRYGESGDVLFDILKETENIVSSILYLRGYYFSELSYFPGLNHSKNHFYFEMMRDDYCLSSDEWFIPTNWQRGTMEEVRAEKENAVQRATKLCEKLVLLASKMREGDFAALRVKFENLRLVALMWKNLVDVFYHYVQFFVKGLDPSEETELVLAMREIENLHDIGGARLGKRFYPFLQDEGQLDDYPAKFLEDLKASFVAEKADTEDLLAEHCLDFCICGGGAEGHKLKKEDNYSDTLIISGHNARIPGANPARDRGRIHNHGWFSYELAVPESGPYKLEIAAGSFTENISFIVTIDGEEPITVQKAVEPEQPELFVFPLKGRAGVGSVRVRIDGNGADTPFICRIDTKI